MKEFFYKSKELNNAFIEFEIYLDGEIFCHLSERDFWIFRDIVEKSGNSIDFKISNEEDI